MDTSSIVSVVSVLARRSTYSRVLFAGTSVFGGNILEGILCLQPPSTLNSITLVDVWIVAPCARRYAPDLDPSLQGGSSIRPIYFADVQVRCVPLRFERPCMAPLKLGFDGLGPIWALHGDKFTDWKEPKGPIQRLVSLWILSRQQWPWCDRCGTRLLETAVKEYYQQLFVPLSQGQLGAWKTRRLIGTIKPHSLGRVSTILAIYIWPPCWERSFLSIVRSLLHTKAVLRPVICVFL